MSDSFDSLAMKVVGRKAEDCSGVRLEAAFRSGGRGLHSFRRVAGGDAGDEGRKVTPLSSVVKFPPSTQSGGSPSEYESR